MLCVMYSGAEKQLEYLSVVFDGLDLMYSQWIARDQLEAYVAGPLPAPRKRALCKRLTCGKKSPVNMLVCERR
jgi:hypothetical protein